MANTSAAYKKAEQEIRDKWARENPAKPVAKPTSAPTGDVRRKLTLPTVQPAKAVEQSPFMAQSTAMGLPYYGQGDFKSWARSFFAKVYDPKQFISNVNDEVYKTRAGKVEKFVEKVTKWSQWGEKIFGITTSELAQSATASQISVEEADNKAGEVFAQTTGILYRTAGQAVMTGLGAFQAFDYAKRKNIVIQEADAALFKQTDAYENIEKSFLYKAAEKIGMAELVLGRGASGNAALILEQNPLIQASIPSAVLAGMRKLVQRAYIIADPDTRGIALDTYEKYWRGSSMAYTMVHDAARRAAFEKAIANGTDPELAALENGNLWTELYGSIMNDPTTYMGWTLVKGVRIWGTGRAITYAEGRLAFVPWKNLIIAELPTIGQVFGVGSKAKTVAAGEAAVRVIGFTSKSEIDRLDDFVKVVDKMDSAGSQPAAIRMIDDMVSRIGNSASDFLKRLETNRVPNTTVLDTASKKSSDAFQSITNAARVIMTKGGDIDERIAVLQSVRNIFSEVPSVRKAAILHVAQDQGKLVASDGIFQLGVMLSKLENSEDITRLVTKVGGNILENEPLIKKLDALASSFYPSMDEMEDATRLLTTKGDDVSRAQSKIDDLIAQAARYGDRVPKNITKELAKAQSAFDAEFGKAAELADLYKEIPDLIKKGRKGLRAYENVPILGSKAVKQYMNTVYMALSPAQTMRQVQSQTVLSAMHLGFFEGIELAVRTAPRAFIQSKTDQLLASNIVDIQKVLGFKPARFIRGVASSGEAVPQKGFKGMLQVTQNLDELMSSEIILRTAKKELGKLTSNPQMFDIAKLSSDFSKDEVNHIYRLLVENYGDIPKTVSEFTKTAQKGTFDTWRYIAMPESLLTFTDDTNLWKSINDIQKNAKNQDEFAKGVSAILSKVTEDAKTVAASMPPVIDANAPDVLRKAFLEAQELQNKGLLDEASTQVFTNKTNAYYYMRNSFKAGIDELATQWELLGVTKVDGYYEAATEYKQVVGNFREVGEDMKRTFNHISDALWTDKSADELVDLIHGKDFDLEKVTGYTLGELRAMDARQFKSKAWSAYKENQANMYRDSQLADIDKAWDAVEKFTKKFKLDVTQLLQKNPKAAEFLHSSWRYEQEAKVWEDFAKHFSTNLEELAIAYDIPSKGQPAFKSLIKALNDNLPEGVAPFLSKADVQDRIEEARRVLDGISREPKAAGAIDKIGDILKTPPAAKTSGTTKDVLKAMRNTPPVSSPGTATNAQFLYNNVTDYKFINETKAWMDEVVTNWGKQVPSSSLSGARGQVLTDWAGQAEKKMLYARTKITAVSEKMRDNILLSYDKSYGDIAMGYFKPYHYWQTHTTFRMFEKFLDHPSWANGYMKYKEAMSSDNKDLPEWWRYNLQIKNLLGMDLKSPIFINFESALNPIYDLTGIDFNDPYKRVDWLSRAIDDMGKMGGSFTPIIQWAVALRLYEKSENDAADRWIGRPAGRWPVAAKALLNKLGIDANLGKFIQHNELDPAVNFLMNGLDPQERKRLGRAMKEMGIPTEEALQAMNAQSGEVWDEAVRRSTAARSSSELASFFLGTNWKSRTANDARIDAFYKEFYAIRNMRDLVTPDQYSDMFTKLREIYPEMDYLLVSGKNTEDRNSAYTYNVLSRIQPTMMDDVLKKFGISNAQISSFYENKGDFSSWNANDKQRFLSAVNDLGAFLSIPSNATRQEWDMAKDLRKEMEKQIAKDLKTDEEYIQGLLEDFNAISKSQTGEKDLFKDSNPMLQQYFDLRTAYIANNALLNAYYGGQETIENYQKGIIRKEMEAKYGEDIYPKYYDYLDLWQPGDKKKVRDSDPVFAKFLKEYYDRLDEVPKLTANFARYLPEGKPIQQWQENLSETQKAMLETLSPAPQVTFDQWRGIMGEPMTALIMDYRDKDIDLPSYAYTKLGKMADDYGYEDANALLETILLSIQ